MNRLRLLYILPTWLLMSLAVLSLIDGSGTLYLRDVLSSHYPLKAAHAHLMDDGAVLPLIDPYRSGGQPLMGNPNALPLYPTNLLYRLASPLWALNAHFWLHWLLAPLTVFLFARRWGLSPPAAWVAGTTYAVSGYVLSLMNLYNLVSGALWLPALGAAFLKASESRRTRPQVELAVVWGLLLLAGDPMTAVLGAAMAATVWLARPPDALKPAVLSVIGSITLGTLLAAPMWVEMLRILPLSYRGYWRYAVETSLAQSWNPYTVVEWIVPLFFGNLEYRFWGLGFFGGNPPLIYSLFPGALAIALVLCAGFPWPGPESRPAEAKLPRPEDTEPQAVEPQAPELQAAQTYPAKTQGEPTPSLRRMRLWCWTWTCIAAFVAAGYHNPAMHYLYQLPGASMLRYPVKIWIVVTLACALLAGLGFDRFLSGRVSLSRRLGGLTLLYLVVWGSFLVLPAPLAALLRAWGGPKLAAPESFAHQRLQWLTSTFFALAACVLMWLLARQARRRDPVWIGAGLLAVHTLSQCFLLQPLIDSDDASYYRGESELEIPPDARLAHGAMHNGFGARPQEMFTRLQGSELFWLPREEHAALIPPAGVARGWEYELHHSPEGLDSFFSLALWQAFKDADDQARVRLLAASGTDYLILNRRLDEVSREETSEETHYPGDVFDTWVYTLKRPLPAVQLVGQAEPSDSMNEALQRLIHNDFDARRQAVMSADRPSLDGPSGQVDVVEDALERLVVNTRSSAPGLLTTRRAWLPIYRAQVDGEAVEVETVNIHKAGVLVPAGEHQVVLETDRRPTWAAATVALSAALMLLGLALGRPKPQTETATA